MPTIVTGIGSLSLAVTGCTGNGVSPIVLTVASVPSSVEAGQLITVSGVVGNTNANGDKTITAVTATTITFAGTGNGAYTSGGTVARKYATPDAWNTATQGAIGAGNIKVGEMYADSVFEQLTPTVLAFGSATGTNASQYRMLRAWGTHYYKARLDSGVKIRRAINSTTTPHVIRIAEPFFRIQGVGVELVDTYVSGGWTTNNVINCEVNNVTILSCTVISGPYHTAAAGTVNGIVAQSGSSIAYTTVIGPQNQLARVGNGIGFGGSAAGEITNCTVYGWDYSLGTSSGGIRSNNPQLLVTNTAVFKKQRIDQTYAVTSGRDINVPSGRAFNCITSDIEWSLGLSIGCVQGFQAVEELAYPEFLDLRPVEGSQCTTQKVGQVKQTTFTKDAEGNALPTGAEGLVNIGAYNQTTVPQSVAPITVVEKTIGTGGDYATIAAWEADTDNHLVGLQQVQRGFLIDASYNEQVTISGAITDKRRYRELRYAGGNRYDALNNTGAYVYSAASTGAVITLDEKYARLTGIKVESTYSGAAYLNAQTGETGPNVIWVSKSDCILDAVVAEQKNVTGSSNATYCFQVRSATADRVRFRNCIALGNSNTAGASVGFSLNGIETRAQNCLSTRMRRTTTGTCFTSAVSTVRFENCFAGNGDVGFNTPSGTQRYNGSVDTTAAGVGSLTGVVVADAFQDATNGDFRLKAASVLADAGVPLDLEFTSDVTGAKWTRPWNIGPFVAFVTPPMYPAAKTARTHRYCPIWKIQTNLGDELRIAGHDSNLYHNGELYEAQSGLDTTAYRAEGGLRDHQLEAFGFISSDRITYADLDAGIYQNAKVTMLLVDWKYPYLAPVHKAVFFLRRIRFDGEQWRAEAEGLSSVLKRTVGRVYSPICPYQLGSPNPQPNGRAGCGVDISQFTEYDIEVASVSDDRRIFRARSSAPNELPSFSDHYFKQGVVTWITGANINRSADVVAYTDSTREITLAIEQPFPIAVGDRFNIVHGDDHTINTCKTRFGNEDNFGGDPYIPGSQRAYQTP
jgi:uncharacterized phage protein (TIGR02218 family)